MEILTPAEIRRLLDAAEEPVRILLLCAVLAGMRRGELLGLRWKDVDLDGNRIHVRRALWRRKLVSPKSRRSRRSIDVAPMLKAALARLPSRFAWEIVFTTPDGSCIDPDNFSHREWARALRCAHLRRIRFHDLRHTYASPLIAQGRTRSTSRRSSVTRRFKRRSIDRASHAGDARGGGPQVGPAGVRQRDVTGRDAGAPGN